MLRNTKETHMQTVGIFEVFEEGNMSLKLGLSD
jgi:hypothetical protein